MWFQKLRAKATERLRLPEMEPVDHSQAEAALEQAMDSHRAAQVQRGEAKQVVSELRQVNLRNGFAPAIAATITKRYGGAH